MSTLTQFRSGPVKLYQLKAPKDEAPNVVGLFDKIGYQFENLNEDRAPGSLMSTKEIKQCDVALRKLDFFNEHLDVPVTPPESDEESSK